MKTIVVLENSELEKISGGEPLNLRLADGSSITIQAETEGKADEARGENGRKSYRAEDRRRKQSKRRGSKVQYRCVCGKRFDTRHAFGGHSGHCAQAKKIPKDRPSVDRKMLTCPVEGCGRRFVHQAWLESHKRREHGA